jgi:hypothetical protein
MRTIGFSSGSLAYADFRRALDMLRGKPVRALELSALRECELQPMVEALDELDLSQFNYISFHAPSGFPEEHEVEVFEMLSQVVRREWPIIVHPDVCHDFELWGRLGPQLCIENMDRRKALGRTVVELQEIFDKLPEASFCLDIGHARQVDSTMAEAHFMLKRFDRRLKQVHMSEVNTSSKHDTLSYASVLAFREVAPLLREEVPVILETPVSEDGIVSEMRLAMEALPTRHEQKAYRWSAPTAAVRA